MNVTLEAVSTEQLEILKNFYALYLHDLSEFSPTLHPNEVVYEDELLVIQMEEFTQDYTCDTLKLDYKTTGFSITSPSETLVYGLSIKN